MEKQWIIVRKVSGHNESGEELRLFSATGTKEEIAEKLVSLCKRDKEWMPKKYIVDWSYHTEKAEDVFAFNGKLSAGGEFFNCYISYIALPIESIVSFEDEISQSEKRKEK